MIKARGVRLAPHHSSTDRWRQNLSACQSPRSSPTQTDVWKLSTALMLYSNYCTVRASPNRLSMFTALVCLLSICPMLSRILWYSEALADAAHARPCCLPPLNAGQSTGSDDCHCLIEKCTSRWWHINELGRSPIHWLGICIYLKLHYFMAPLISHVQPIV